MAGIMDQTPKVKRRSVLTIGGQLRNKKYRGSPNRSPHSASITLVSAKSDIECTPPHKKFDLEDSVDYSPKLFDLSYSPGSMLSQTQGFNSPEVSWRWGKRTEEDAPAGATLDDDSAYATESSFKSTSSRGARSEKQQNRRQRLAYEIHKEEQRQTLEQERHRAEKTRAEEMLKMRCAKLEEQLRGNGASGVQEKQTKAQAATQMDNTSKEACTKPKTDNIGDFFNDSDSDFLLLEATQELETKNVQTAPNTTTKTEIPKKETPREKRSSMYMKFLEDDSEDWLQSLDEVIELASKNKKARTSFQRYKSMPVETTSTTTNCTQVGPTTTSTSTGTTVTTKTGATTKLTARSEVNSTTGSSIGSDGLSKIKRHASFNAFGTTNANQSRGSPQQPLAKR